MTPEGRVEDHLCRKCRSNSILCFKFTSSSNSGVPDRVLIKNGKIVFLELKAPGKEPRKMQKAVIHKLLSAGAEVEVADTTEKTDEIIDYMRSQLSFKENGLCISGTKDQLKELISLIDHKSKKPSKELKVLLSNIKSKINE